MVRASRLSPLERYDRSSCAAAAQIMRHYSTSFSLATQLLHAPVRTDIRNLYAMVRTADEIVDSGLDPAEAAGLLDSYEDAVRCATQQRFHPDPVLHAFALSARRCGFRDEHLKAFFASMRRDLTQSQHTEESFAAYVYGSAEVIGLLCLDAFYSGRSHPASLEEGAQRLGAAFQKINFLRDLHEDTARLGRTYFPGLDAARGLDETTKNKLIAEIRADLDAARRATQQLPRGSRLGVAAATALFSELTDILEATPAAEIMRKRVSVPPARKSYVVARAAAEALF
ncbi:phytoene/squalene synthase family protein [Corynebacterium sp.]|uniref:phytoene/squalene synthase family protein n=1 Tax=Corynebacterium sp. TaxID=1720 RepID=UPI0026DC241F|nr:phytoene/squalene synthase family protein [Corynebacterium sp.]MDO5033010.1 phytoene/squalene synthase family protein [Corynebacterium sp.]